MAEENGRVAEQVAKWRDELVDLSRRNKLLNATAGKERSGVLRISQPSMRRILSELGLLEVRGRGYWRFHYPPSADLEDADPAALAALHAEDPDISDELEDEELLTGVTSALVLSRKLRNLERQAANEFMDRGARNLYLGFGVLRWAEVRDEWRESPILLVPTRLERSSPRDPFCVLPTDEDPAVNPALRVKLENDFAIELPELESLDGAEELIAVVRQRIGDQAGWTVSEDTLFGRFSFQKEAMYQDLRANLGQILESPLLCAVADNREEGTSFAFDVVPEEELDEKAPPEELASILDADSTQRQCIIAARDGRSFVMDGPPGTGKSQTIANVIAELLKASRTVLFVSENAAALDVVKSRLDRANLGSYVLELHSNKATRKEVAQALGNALAERPRPLRELDASQLNRVKQLRISLSAYAAAQNEKREPFGASLHWAIGRRLQLAAAPAAPAPQLIDPLDWETFEGVLDLARQLAANWGPVEGGGGFLWRDLSEPEELVRERSNVSAVLDRAKGELDVCRERFEGSAASFELPFGTTGDDFERHLEIARLFDRRVPVPPTWLTAEANAVEERSRLIGDWQGRSLRHREIAERLDSMGRSWRDIDVEVGERFAGCVARGGGLDPALQVDDLSRAEVDGIADALIWVRTNGPDLDSAARDLQDALGLSVDDAPGAVDQAVALGNLGSLAHLPERSWFEPERLTAAKQALSRIRPVVENHRSLVDQIETVFNSTIFQFDIETLFDGPSDMVPKLSRMSGRGRANRKQLKVCVQAGKISPEVMAALPLVRQLRAKEAELAGIEQSSGDVLGDTYYRSTSTDLEALSEAIDLAERALRLLGATNAADAVGAQLSVGALQVEAIAGRADRVAEALVAWRRRLDTKGLAKLVTLPVRAVVDWATRGKHSAPISVGAS